MVYIDLAPTEFISESLNRSEGSLTNTGALLVNTGNRSGRSPNDRFIVDESSTTKSIEWGDVNRPFSEENFNILWAKVEKYLSTKDLGLIFMWALILNIIFQSRSILRQLGKACLGEICSLSLKRLIQSIKILGLS